MSVDALRAEIEQLYRERFVGFRNGVATVTGDYESARDAVQEGFARALRSAAQFRGEGSLEGWLWRIVFRVALEQVRETYPSSLADFLREVDNFRDADTTMRSLTEEEFLRGKERLRRVVDAGNTAPRSNSLDLLVLR